MLANSQPAPTPPPDQGYILIEELGGGPLLRDVFAAPSNAEAIARAQGVLGSGKAELWHGEQLIWSRGPADERTALARHNRGGDLS